MDKYKLSGGFGFAGFGSAQPAEVDFSLSGVEGNSDPKLMQVNNLVVQMMASRE